MVKATSPVVRFIEEANSGLLLAEAGVQLSSVFHVEHIRLMERTVNFEMSVCTLGS